MDQKESINQRQPLELTLILSFFLSSKSGIIIFNALQHVKKRCVFLFSRARARALTAHVQIDSTVSQLNLSVKFFLTFQTLLPVPIISWANFFRLPLAAAVVVVVVHRRVFRDCQING